MPPKEVAITNPVLAVNSFVFHLRAFEDESDGGHVDVVDVYETKDAPTDLRIVAIVHQVIVMSEVSVDQGAVKTASGLLRSQVKQLRPERLPFYLSLLAKNLGIANAFKDIGIRVDMLNPTDSFER